MEKYVTFFLLGMAWAIGVKVGEDKYREYKDIKHSY